MITIIAAIGESNELGKNNDLIWHLSADLKRFRKLTTGNTIVMGRNTYESIGKPLPNRRSIVITRNTEYKIDGCDVVNSLEDAIELASNDNRVFIIGGAQIYQQAIKLNKVDTLDITVVHDNFDADVYFPEIDKNVWKLYSEENYKADEKNPYDYSFLSYIRV